MFGWVWLILVLFVGLTVVYAVVSLYSRSVRKEKLERLWDEAPQSPDPAARDAFIDRGLAEYRGSLRRRLILLVYVVPVVFILLLVWLTNAN